MSYGYHMYIMKSVKSHIEIFHIIFQVWQACLHRAAKSMGDERGAKTMCQVLDAMKKKDDKILK